MKLVVLQIIIYFEKYFVNLRFIVIAFLEITLSSRTVFISKSPIPGNFINLLMMCYSASCIFMNTTSISKIVNYFWKCYTLLKTCVLCCLSSNIKKLNLINSSIFCKFWKTSFLYFCFCFVLLRCSEAI